jgi:hypothetical protein
MNDIDISVVTKYLPERLESLIKLTTERSVYNSQVMWECLYQYSNLGGGGETDLRESTALVNKKALLRALEEHSERVRMGPGNASNSIENEEVKGKEGMRKVQEGIESKRVSEDSG